MRQLTALALVVLVANPVMAQTRKNDYQLFDGASISIGVTAKKSATTTAAGVEESGSSNVGVAKLSYTFASDSRYKLSVSANADLQKSPISSTIAIQRKTPTELNIEPSYLLTSTLISYAKLGVFAASYSTPFGSQNIGGSSYGVGIKSLLTENIYLQGELTQHKASGSTTLGWDKYKQTSTSVLLGYYFY
jgi:hypothetical protein